MKDKEDYIKDIAEVRSIMERSTKFLSLSGLAVVLIGVYALLAVFIAYQVIGYEPRGSSSSDMINKLLGFGAILLFVSVITVLYLSHLKATRQHERLWNPTFRRLLVHASVPLLAGGILILIFVAKDLFTFILPLSLLFYGLMLYTAGKFTFPECQSIGLVEIALGLFSAYFTQYALGSWAAGFGLVHIGLGLYLYFRYER